MQRRATPTEARRHEEDAVPAVAPAPPSPASRVLDLQRTLGNQGVVSTARPQQAEAPPKPIDIDVDDTAGTIKSTAGELIGFKTADEPWYATPGAAAPSAARSATSRPRPARSPILKVKKSTVTVGADGSETMTQEGAEAGAVLGATPALVLAGKTPVEHAKLPDALKTTVPANARIILDDGKRLARGDVPRRHRAQLGLLQALQEGVRGPQEADLGRDRHAPRGPEDEAHARARLHGDDLDARGRRSARAASRSSRRTASTTSHGKKGWTGTRAPSKADAEKEAAEHEKANKDHDADVARSPATAPPASASISGRWTRTRPGAAARWSSSSRRCRARATAAEAKKPADRSEEEAIYVEAWEQCTTAGLTIVRQAAAQRQGRDGTRGRGRAGRPDGHRRAAQVPGHHHRRGARRKLWTQAGRARHVGQPDDRQQVHGDERRARTPTFPTDKYTIKLAAPSKVATIGEVCTDDRLSWPWRTSSPTAPLDGLAGVEEPDRRRPETLAAGLIAKIVKAAGRGGSAAASAPAARRRHRPRPAARPKKQEGQARRPRRPSPRSPTTPPRTSRRSGPAGARLAVRRQAPTRTSAGRVLRDRRCSTTRARTRRRCPATTGASTRRRRPASASSATTGSRARTAWRAPSRCSNEVPGASPARRPAPPARVSRRRGGA